MMTKCYKKILKKIIKNIIGDYFNSSEAAFLFNPNKNEFVDDCLSRQIDFFNNIINNKFDVSIIVNKALEENCELTTKQNIIIRQRIHYLQMAYFNMLNLDLNVPVLFKECCKKAIKQMCKIGIKIVSDYKIIMIWNRIFRVNEIIPHPTYYIEMGELNQPIF